MREYKYYTCDKVLEDICIVNDGYTLMSCTIKCAAGFFLRPSKVTITSYVEE